MKVILTLIPNILYKYKYLIELVEKTIYQFFFAQVAQLVEQRTENPCVTGSIPVLGTMFN